MLSAPAAIIPHRMRVELEGVTVSGAGWSEACATTIENASGYVVSVITVLPSRTIALVSAYVADLSGTAAVTHMALPAREPAAFSQRLLEQLPGASHARACLLDHAGELQALLDTELSEQVSVTIPETTLAAANTVWGQPND